MRIDQRKIELMLLCLLSINVSWTAFIALYDLDHRKRWLNRQWHVRPYYKERHHNNKFSNWFNKIKQDSYLFKKFFRMDIETFEHLYSLVNQHMMEDTRKASISTKQRLAITIRCVENNNSHSIPSGRTNEITNRNFYQKN